MTESRKDYLKQWREKNKEKSLEYGRKWKRNNKEKSAEYAKKYAETHRENLKQNQAKYRERHPDRVREYSQQHKQSPEKAREYYASRSEESLEAKREAARKWYQNPDNRRKHDEKRRARKTNTITTLTESERQEILAAGCLFADGTCEGVLTIAHDNPVSKGGNTTRGNTFCLCLKHNSKMQTKTLAQMLKQLFF